MYTFRDLQDEVKRRATRDQGGTQFDTAIKNIVNTSLFRTARESNWRVLRKKTTFVTKATYTTGSGAGAFTNDSSTITITGATFLTDGIEIGRRIKLSGDATFHTIQTITGETTLTIEEGYGGTNTTTGTYSILGQEEYNLPVQVDHRTFLWHEAFGFPWKMWYVTDQDFYTHAHNNTNEAVPEIYRAWGSDMVNIQLREASTITVASSASGDTSIDITIFGIVSGLPDFETIATNASNGTTSVTGSKSFTTVERIVKGASTVGRITVTGNSGNTTVATIPVGDITAGIKFSKVQIYPLPNTVFNMNVHYYKQPYRLVNDQDVHELGQAFDEAIILLATSKVKGESEIKLGTSSFFTFWQDEITNLKKTNVDKIDFFPRMRPPSMLGGGRGGVHPFLGFRQIGANFGPRSRF